MRGSVFVFIFIFKYRTILNDFWRLVIFIHFRYHGQAKLFLFETLIQGRHKVAINILHEIEMVFLVL